MIALNSPLTDQLSMRGLLLSDRDKILRDIAGFAAIVGNLIPAVFIALDGNLGAVLCAGHNVILPARAGTDV